MDVRCTRCATEYEFDDTKVVGTGVTVKCSSCGHVFKVSASGNSITGPIATVSSTPRASTTGPIATEWIVRKGDGTTARLKELTTLQKWIVEQRVTRVDEISRTGKSWKRLGEIQELASFFQVVDAANIAAAQPTMHNVVAQHDPAFERAAGNPLAYRSPAPLPTGNPTALAPGEGMASTFNANSTLAELEDDDPVLAWRRRHHVRNAAILVLVVVIVGGAVAYLRFPAQTRAALEPWLTKVGVPWPESADEKRVRELLSEVPAVRLADDDAKMLALRNRLEELAPQQQENGAFLAHAALVNAALALHAEERVRLLGLLNQNTRDTQTAVDEKVRFEQSADVYAARVRRIASSLGLGFVANAWVRALKGERSEMAADLEVATSISEKNAETVAEARALNAIVTARQALQSASLDEMKRAFVAIEQASAAAPDDRRLQYFDAALAVEALALATDPDAIAALNIDRQRLVVAVTNLGADGNEGRAALLLRRLNRSAAAEPPPSEPADTETTTTTTTTDDFATLMKRANRARVGDKTRAALALYKQASEARPHDAKPDVGMGWSYLDLGSATKAVSAFRRATQKAPELPVAHFGLAEALMQSGDKAAAAAAFDVVLRLDPVGPDSAHARRALKRLKGE